MKRENRYIVIKRADLEYVPPNYREALDHVLNAIRTGRKAAGKVPEKRHVTIADDWPMYEKTWALLEEWVDSLPSKTDQKFMGLDVVVEDTARRYASLQALQEAGVQLLHEQQTEIVLHPDDFGALKRIQQGWEAS